MLHHSKTRIWSRDDTQRGNFPFDQASAVRLVEGAVCTIEGCDAAGLFTVADETVMTNAWTDDAIVALDQVQFDNDEGPCLDAVCERVPYWARDLAFDPRWPTFGVRALEFGLRSMLAVPFVRTWNLHARVVQPDARCLQRRRAGGVVAFRNKSDGLTRTAFGPRRGNAMNVVRSLWASAQGDPKFMRRVNGLFTISYSTTHQCTFVARTRLTKFPPRRSSRAEARDEENGGLCNTSDPASITAPTQRGCEPAQAPGSGASNA